MHRVVALIGVALLFAGLAAPGVEAVLGCAQTCPDGDAQGRCGDDMCCSCCVYAVPAMLNAKVTAAPAPLASLNEVATNSAALDGERADLLHVPKAIRS